MQITVSSGNNINGTLILPLFQGTEKLDDSIVGIPAQLRSQINNVLSDKDFKGKAKTTLTLLGSEGGKAMLVGLGKKEDADANTYRKAGARVVKARGKTHGTELTVKLDATEVGLVSAFAEGLLLRDYSYNHYKTMDEDDKEEERILALGLSMFPSEKSIPLGALLRLCEFDDLDEVREVVADEHRHARRRQRHHELRDAAGQPAHVLEVLQHQDLHGGQSEEAYGGEERARDGHHVPAGLIVQVAAAAGQTRDHKHQRGRHHAGRHAPPHQLARRRTLSEVRAEVRVGVRPVLGQGLALALVLG